jgi:hypothetical protein
MRLHPRDAAALAAAARQQRSRGTQGSGSSSGDQPAATSLEAEGALRVLQEAGVAPARPRRSGEGQPC